ncbi:RNA polymerase sigma factor [Methyloligella sp. 2.7D]|uniref:RNA polymerase sigma factor n=1 Tax=unclassified Methyloligella TaxID=2625955 RepID=UPI00157C2CF1|nr:RNA polymerase sigma factor [Methyloligella sp. GL2]QKP77874.1 RNA polymerase sigma factor [Methyloligella sp. GL2]
MPRLKRFAEVLLGEREGGTALLGRALSKILEEDRRYSGDVAFDCWAFGEIYRHWLDELRGHADPMRRPRGLRAFEELISEDQDVTPDDLTVTFLAELAPQQRCTLLLVYGEDFSHEEAAQVLDCPAETIEARLIRASATLADALSDDEKLPPMEAEVESFPQTSEAAQ